ncbi:hypothetical protein SAMN05428962_4512 [Paenibacillus sp. BC26]|nr:hypothetical protein SAMN05428962_4512 [Paenibacillus sp. BC26]
MMTFLYISNILLFIVTIYNCFDGYKYIMRAFRFQVTIYFILTGYF